MSNKGKCLECGVPLSDPGSTGYCMPCAETVYERQRKEFPFAVVDGNGQAMEGFRTEAEAQDYLWSVRRAEIVRS